MQESAGECANLAQALDPFTVGGDDAAHDVTVAAQVLGRAVQHEGRAVFGRSLQHGRGEGVVDEERHVTRGVGDRAQVDELERRVRGSLDDDQTRVGADRVADLRDIRPRHLGAEQAAREHVVGSAVEGANGDDVRPTRRGGRDERRGECSHPRCERDRTLGALEPGKRLLETGDAGLPESLVHGGTTLAEVMPGRELLVGEAAGLDRTERVRG